MLILTPFPYFMRKFSLLPILCPLLLCGLTFQASVQEEIPYFHNLLQHAPQLQLTKTKPTPAFNQRTTADACNVSANGDFETQLQAPNHEQCWWGSRQHGNWCNEAPRPISKLVLSYW
jgi:hypothetical protein